MWVSHQSLVSKTFSHTIFSTINEDSNLVGEVPAHCNGKVLEKAHNDAAVDKIAVFYLF
jgi:hypothetical protein